MNLKQHYTEPNHGEQKCQNTFKIYKVKIGHIEINNDTNRNAKDVTENTFKNLLSCVVRVNCLLISTRLMDTLVSKEREATVSAYCSPPQ